MQFGPGTQTCQVRPGTWLRIALAPSDLTRHDFWNMLHDLIDASGLQQHRSEHADAETGEGDSGVDAAQFLIQNDGFFFVEAAAAIFRWPGGTGPALGCHPLQPQLAVRIFKTRVATSPHHFIGHHRGTHGLGAVCLQPFPRA